MGRRCSGRSTCRFAECAFERRNPLSGNSTVAVETIMAILDIHTEYKKWKSGKIVQTRKEFIAEVVDKVILVICRAGGSIAGMIVGQIVSPVPVVGALVGALVGVFSGHLVGKLVLAKKNVKGTLVQCIRTYR